MLTDRFGRQLNYLRISVTDLCNLRCLYCMGEDGIAKKEHGRHIISVEDIIKIAEAFVSLGIDKIRLTGGEPLVRNGIEHIIKGIGRLAGVKTFALTTNGVLLPKYLDALVASNVTSLNISIDTLDPKKYREITRLGNIDEVLLAIENAYERGIKKIKINTVLINGFNDNEIDDFINLTVNRNIDVRFIELMAIGSGVTYAHENFLSNDVVIKDRDDLIKVETEDISSPADYYKRIGAKGRVGLISPISCKFCNDCNRLRITADGKLKTCLHSNDEHDLRPFLNDIEELKAEIERIVCLKPKEHNLLNNEFVFRNMNEIGG